MSSLPALAPGLADPVHDGQHVFRAAMNALARPGSVHRLEHLPPAPEPLSPVAAALMLTLADHETQVWLDPALAASAEVAAYLRFHTGARLVADAAMAAFAVVSDPGCLPSLESLSIGTLDYPDRSTTLIVQVGTLDSGAGWQLAGPGVDGAVRLAVAPLPTDFLVMMARNRALFPRGVDILLAAPDRIAGLPRTTVVRA